MRFCLAAIILFLSFARLVAQSEAPYEMPNPEDYLSPNIRYELLPVLRHDNESREILYYNPENN